MSVSIIDKEELKEKILELRMQYYSTEKIANMLGITQDTVTLYMKILVYEGKLEESYLNLKRSNIDERSELIIKLIQEKKEINDIAEAMELSLDTIYRYIDRLVDEGRITKEEVSLCTNKMLEERILELRNKGYTKGQISTELHIGSKTTFSMLKKLEEEEKVGNLNKRTAFEVKKQIMEDISRGYTVEEMSNELKLRTVSIENYIGKLIEKGEINEREMLKKREERREKIKDDIRVLLIPGTMRKDISRRLKIPPSILNPIMEEILKEGKISKPVKTKRTVTYKNILVEEFEQKLEQKDEPCSGTLEEQRENESVIRECKNALAFYRKEGKLRTGQYYVQCAEIAKRGGKLEKEELDGLAECVEYKNRKLNVEQLKFVCVEYCKLGCWKSAVQVVTRCIEAYGESQSLVEFRKVILELQKKQKAKDLIKQGMPVTVIMQETGISEIEILRMKREYSNRKNAVDVEECGR